MSRRRSKKTTKVVKPEPKQFSSEVGFAIRESLIAAGVITPYQGTGK